MRLNVFFIALCFLVPLASQAQETRTYRWVDDEGVVHFGDSIPPEFAEKPKQVLNEHGVTIQYLEGRKTQEQIEAERVARDLEVQMELQRRADQALLATYVNVEEITMHRDRRIELFQAQARVTELYLRNLHRRLDSLQGDARRFKPYSSDPNAPTVDPDLVDEITHTNEAIKRHEINLQKYRSDERQIIERFQGDITRFIALKGVG
ncbi:MAG: DUF4124 domain-containing protein [Desulfobulbaceae bacterium]|nr:DUF4124 domain-containing protein [Desulfobulbaceae bacterium]